MAADQAGDRGDSLREAIAAEHARILARLFDPGSGATIDPELAARCLALVRGVAALPREHLLGLRLMPGALPDAVEVPPGAEREAAAARALGEVLLFRRAADHAGLGFAVADVQGRLLYANDTLCRMYGEASAGAVVGRAMADYLPEASRGGFPIAMLAPALREGRWVGELAILSRQGVETPAIQTLFTVPDERGRAPHVAALVLDITERKRAETALRQSEEAFRTVAERALAGLLVLDGAGLPLYMNPRAEEITGYSLDEFRRLGPMPNLHPDDAARVIGYARARAAGRPAPTEYEMRIVRPDGAIATLLVSASRTTWHGVAASFAFFADVTWRKQAERALRESEEKYRELVEGIEEMIFSLDRRGALTYASPAVEPLSGYTAAEVEGRHFSLFVDPADLPRLGDQVRRLLAGEVPGPSEYRLLRKDGSRRWVRSSSRPILREGAVVGLRGTMIDIHDRRRSEEALRESEAKYAAVVEQARVGVVILQEGIILYVNRFGAEQVGYAPVEMIGQPLARFLAPEDRAAQAEIHQRRMRGEPAPAVYRAIGLHRDGSRLLFENSTILIQYGGRPAALAVIRPLGPAEAQEGERS